ncbi:MAG: hypothetical protein HY791_38205 [Deltaproteobacteria bacterium]|nr:hypothetical protein [Deltaproteobacteria bacterium]
MLDWCCDYVWILGLVLSAIAAAIGDLYLVWGRRQLLGRVRLALSAGPRGRADGRLVARDIEVAEIRVGEGNLRISVDLNFPTRIRIEPAWRMTSLIPGLVRWEVVLTGSAAFDSDLFVVAESARDALARLNHRARAGILALVPLDRWKISDGRLSYASTGTTELEVTAEIERISLWANEIAAGDESTYEMLFDNACNDPEPGVRATNLRFLREAIRDDIGLPLLARSAQKATQDALPHVRLVGGVVLGPRGVPTLEALAFDADAPTEVRLEALATLPSKRHPELVRKLELELGRGDPAVASMVVQLIERIGHRPSASAVRTAFGRLSDETKLGLIGVLNLRDPELETFLLEILSLETDESVLSRVVDALFVVGGAASARALAEARRSRSLPEVIYKRAREAEQVIRARVSLAGQLSLARMAGSTGGLSPTSQEGGLSRPEDAVGSASGTDAFGD